MKKFCKMKQSFRTSKYKMITDDVSDYVNVLVRK